MRRDKKVKTWSVLANQVQHWCWNKTHTGYDSFCTKQELQVVPRNNNTLERWKNTACSDEFHLSHSRCVTQCIHHRRVLLLWSLYSSWMSRLFYAHSSPSEVPLSSRCVLGTETSFKKAHWMTPYFDYFRGQAGGWRRREEMRTHK